VIDIVEKIKFGNELIVEDMEIIGILIVLN
jgi:hypothetical protein